tara:strand:+ start:75 stop:416 length:342 start_codon:yes stop_codon:yes gene_type:complete
MGFGRGFSKNFNIEYENECKIKKLKDIEVLLSSNQVIENINEIENEIKENSEFNVGCQCWALINSNFVDINKVSNSMFCNTEEYKILSEKQKEWIDKLISMVSNYKLTNITTI